MGINKKYLDALIKCKLFEKIDSKNIRKLLIPENIIKVKKNDELLSKDNKNNCIYILLKGSTVTKLNDNETNLILSNDKVSDIIGLSSIYSNNEKNALLTTSLSNCVFLKLEQEYLEKLMKDDYQLYKNLMTAMCNNMNIMLERIKGFTAGSAEKKLALYIKQISKDNNLIKLETSMSKLAIELDLGRASLYRALATLENNNIIIKIKKEIKILDRAKLDRMCR